MQKLIFLTILALIAVQAARQTETIIFSESTEASVSIQNSIIYLAWYGEAENANNDTIGTQGGSCSYVEDTPRHLCQQYFTESEGNILYFSCGSVPDVDRYVQPCSVIGGSGKFNRASGTGTSNYEDGTWTYVLNLTKVCRSS
eukprot:TRINITY_DN692_c0_g1_i1.p1 TRINITY_DN692_c0_g1~~TRINITY_DN692_c0_g1_i1.p1  ORF type:complete len:143 (-),score=25.36 TRINITY_DN692_c0_g1_i1:22-450(-)